MVGAFMIPINNLQAKIYQALSKVGVDVYDEVVEEAITFIIHSRKIIISYRY